MTPSRRSVVLIAAREIGERVRSRAFLISTVVMVAVVVAGVIGPALKDETAVARVGVTGRMPPALEGALREVARRGNTELRMPRYPSLAAGEAAVRDEDVGVLVVDGRRLVWKSDPDPRVAAIVAGAVQSVRTGERAAALGLTAAQTEALLEPARMPARLLDAPDADRDSRETIAAVGVLLLLLVVLFYGNAVAEGVAQEKGNRVMEVLLSRVSGQDLLTGKVVGIGLVGMAQVLLALIAGVAAMLTVEQVDVPAAVPATLALTVLWFALGYAFWSVAFAAVGALVSRVEDLQPSIAPLQWILTLSALCALFASGSPDAWYVRLASFVPITAPFVMPVRTALGEVSAGEVALAAAVMLCATYALVRLAAGVYSGALLCTGGRPRLHDVWRAARDH